MNFDSSNQQEMSGALQGPGQPPSLPMRAFAVTYYAPDPDSSYGTKLTTETIIAQMGSPINEDGDRWTFSVMKVVPGLGIVQSLVRHVNNVEDIKAEDLPETRLSLN